MGVSPVTGPTPNKGYEAAGMQKLGIVVKAMGELIPLLGATSEAGQEVLKSLQRLAKYVPAGAVTPAAERNELENRMLKNQQNSAQMQQMRQGMTQQQPQAA
jgi:hypothetical protein